MKLLAYWLMIGFLFVLLVEFLPLALVPVSSRIETIAKVLSMPIELKGNNYYSKVFERVNYKLQITLFE